MFVSRGVFRLCVTLMLVCLVFTGVVYAQDGIPIAFGQTVPGEVTAEAAIVHFRSTITGPPTRDPLLSRSVIGRVVEFGPTALFRLGLRRDRVSCFRLMRYM